MPAYRNPFIGPDCRSYPAESPDAICDFDWVRTRSKTLLAMDSESRIDGKLLQHLAGWVHRLQIENTQLRYECEELRQKAERANQFVSAWRDFAFQASNALAEED